MAINGNNNVNENEETFKKDNTKLEKIFIKEFCNEQILSNTNKNTFLNNIFDRSEMPTDLMSRFLSDNNDKYRGLKLYEITLNKLKKYLVSIYLELKNNQDNLNTLLIKSFNLDKKQKSIINDEILKISDITLKDLIKNENNRNKFAKKILGSNISSVYIDSFKNFFPISKEYEKKIELLSIDDQKELKSVLSEIKNGKITDSGLKILIELDFLSVSEKKDIVKNLIPTISLKNAIDLTLLTNLESNKIKLDLIKKYLKKSNFDFDNESSELIDKIKNEDVLLPIDDFLSNNNNILNISENVGFKNVENTFNEYINEVKDNKNINGPVDFESFKSNLKELENVIGSEKITKGSVFRFISKGNNSVYSEDFLRVDDFDDKEKILKCSQIGSKKSRDDKTFVNLSGVSSFNKSYFDYISILKNKKGNNIISLEILTSDDFKDLLNDKNEYQIDSNNLKLSNINNIKNDKSLQQQITKNLDNTYSKQINELENELKDLNIEIESLKNKTLEDSRRKSRLENLNIKKNQLEEKLKSIKNYKYDLISGNLNEGDRLQLLKEQNNFDELLNQLNLVDSEGTKIGLLIGTILSNDSGVYEIVGIDFKNQTLNIDSNSGLESNISYEAFFQSFKSSNAKRSNKINNFNEILQKNKWDNEFEFKNGNLIQKDVVLNGKKEDRDVEYFVNDDGNIMKIVSIGKGEVEVIHGDLKEGVKNKNTKNVDNKIELDKSSVKFSLSHFYKYILDNKYLPDWKIGKNYTITGKIDGYENEIKGSFFTRYFNRMSIKEIYMAGKMTVDGALDYLKRGNELKSAELAMKMGGIIGGDFAEDFMAQTELKQAEAMDKELTALGKIASPNAFKRILKWLLNKDTPEYKKEAGLMLASKYGVLYPKELAEYNGKFLWYEALGGKIGDEKYEEEKEKARKLGQPFDEKELLIGLLGSQSLGYSKPKRRSKFYKDFKGKIAGGFGDEYDTGYKDAKDKRTIYDMNTGGLLEANTGVVPNALGWAKRAVEKGGSLKEMNEIYFALIHSGGLYNTSTNILEELKGHWTGEGNGMILAAFGSSLNGQKLFNKTVLEVSKDIEESDKNYNKGIYKKALELYNDSENNSKDYKKRVDSSIKFWNEYGDVLSRTLFMADGKENNSDKFLKTDKIIEFGRDNKYRDYYNHLKDWTAQPTAFNKNFMSDDVGSSGVTGLDTYEIMKQFYRVESSRTFRGDMKPTIDLTWSTIWGDVILTKKRYESESDLGKKESYRKYLNKKLREITSGLMNGAGKDILSTLDSLDPCGLDLGSIGIKISNLGQYRISEVLDGTKGKDIFDNAVENVLSGVKLESNKLGDVGIFSAAKETVDTTKNNTNGIIDNNDIWD